MMVSERELLAMMLGWSVAALGGWTMGILQRPSVTGLLLIVALGYCVTKLALRWKA
jgi:hypothetical protein